MPDDSFAPFINTQYPLTQNSSIILFPDVTDVTGKVVEITREDYCSATLVCEGEGVMGTHGVTIGGTLYGAGQSMSVYFNDCKLFLRVQSIEVIE